MTNLLSASILVFFLAVSVFGQEKLPRLEDFQVSGTLKVKPASVKLSSRRAREFRTMLRTNAEQGVNFAGHYVVVTWGCGSDCRSIAIIDARNGNVYFTPSLLWIGK
jgi:hypothetical protein